MNGVALGAAAVGSVFLYSAIKGKSILASAQAVISGKSPGTVAQANPISAVIAPTIPGGNAPAVNINPSGLPSGSTYSHAQLMTLWTTNGGSANTANNAACHGIQESGGRANATSSNPDGGENIGIWQLDTKGVGAGYTPDELMNADNNARITIAATQNGTNWAQWATPGC
jgi:hypothetical protein